MIVYYIPGWEGGRGVVRGRVQFSERLDFGGSTRNAHMPICIQLKSGKNIIDSFYFLKAFLSLNWD